MTLDALQHATEAGNRPSLIPGEVDISAQFVVLKKGQRKQAYDKQLHAPSDMRTEVSLRILPLAETNMKYPVERNIIAENDEWRDIVWPSARDLGCKSARDLQDKWALIELVDTGRSWTNQKGDTVKGTTIRFHGLFDDEQTCLQAWRNGGSESPAQEAEAEQPVQSTVDREMAYQFLQALVKQAKGDRQRLAELIDGIEQVKAHFTVDSPEVAQLMTDAVPF